MDGKGAKDRYTVPADSGVAPLREHLERVKLTHQEDLRGGHGAVYLPGALERKYPGAAREWSWRYVLGETFSIILRDLEQSWSVAAGGVARYFLAFASRADCNALVS